MKATVYDWSLGSGTIWYPQAELYVNNYSWNAIGGPEQASLSARGSILDMSELAKFLRCPVVIEDDRAVKVWWGYVYSVTIRIGSRSINLSMGQVNNKIAITYSLLTADQQNSTTKYTTPWAQDALSVARYGTKQYLGTLTDTSEEAAIAMRDTFLANNKLPRREVTIASSQGGSWSALINCKGWFSGLGWQLYSAPTGVIGYTVNGQGVQNFGNTTTSKIAQSFLIATPGEWYSDTAAIQIRKFGTPSDNVIFELCADSAGVPGTVLSSATLAGTGLTESYSWNTVKLGTRVTITPSTTYWLQIRRSGAGDNTNYYSVNVDEALGYVDGAFKVYTTGWGNRSPDADMLFKIGCVRQTTTQMSDMLAGAQFVTSVEIQTASGVYTNPYRSGETSMLRILSELLDVGSGSIRYLATMSPERKLTIYQQPSDIEYYVDENDNWFNTSYVPLPRQMCPVGIWYGLLGLPPLVNAAEVSDPGRFFIERSQYETTNQILTVAPPKSPVLGEAEFI